MTSTSFCQHFAHDIGGEEHYATDSNVHHLWENCLRRKQRIHHHLCFDLPVLIDRWAEMDHIIAMEQEAEERSCGVDRLPAEQGCSIGLGRLASCLLLPKDEVLVV